MHVADSVAQQELKYLYQPTAIFSLTLGVIGAAISTAAPIKAGVGLVFGLSGSLVATIAAPIFTFLLTGSSTAEIRDPEMKKKHRIMSSAFLIIGGAVTTEVLVGFGVSTIALFSVGEALEILVAASLAKMVARICFHSLQAAISS